MDEILAIIKSKTKSKRAIGFFMVLLGLVFYLIPFLPGSWAIIIGLEVLGVRFLVQDKFSVWARGSRHFKWLGKII